MGRRIAGLAVALCAVFCAALPAAASAHRGHGGHPSGAVTPVASGSGGAVASMDVGASQAGIDVLKRGGNAVDAAVATASALGVTVPWVAGPGGGGFMVIYNARSHTVTTVDGRETCPAACTSTMFLNSSGQPQNYTAASDQPLSTGVPSNLATWATALRHYGRLSLGDDLQPAIKVARRGFAVNFDFNQLEQSSLSTLQAYPASRSLLLTPSGDPLPVGTWLRNPDLAHTYELIARHGASALYDGPIGQAIVQAVDHPVLTPGQTVVNEPGIMTTGDLRAYRTRILAPTKVNYRGLDVYGMAPPSSGGSTEGEILNILNGFPLSSEPRAKALFQYLEASRLAYADRNAYVGDPDFVNVPLSGLLDPAFAASRRCLIGNTAATSPVAPGSPFAPFGSCPAASASSQASSASPEAHHTNNIVTEDKWGDVVAYTNTINFFGGSGQVVPGYGFLLNDELTDFDFAPPSAGATDPNLPAPGKEPRSSMGPVIALQHGQPQFAIGAAGGSTIIETVVQTLINHVDFGMSLSDALAAPRVAQTNSSSNTSEAEPDFFNSQLAQQLTSQYGEKFSLATGPILPLDNYPGDATALQMLGRGQAEAIAEPVRLGGGSALALQGERGSGGSHQRGSHGRGHR
ncbi:MAG TPA: gamma-glutamyltransferase [Solirubrobacteraceae bacterium]|jgi:gamma-glutamyltranspeptidase / glutathione hydrolase